MDLEEQDPTSPRDSNNDLIDENTNNGDDNNHGATSTTATATAVEDKHDANTTDVTESKVERAAAQRKQKLKQQARPKNSDRDDEIIIHVNDDARKMTKDFKCNRAVLLKYVLCVFRVYVL